jgi:hypothetical protein
MNSTKFLKLQKIEFLIPLVKSSLTTIGSALRPKLGWQFTVIVIEISYHLNHFFLRQKMSFIVQAKNYTNLESPSTSHA